MLTMLKVTNFIKNNPNWRELLSAEPYNISIKDDGRFTILKYSQINSDFSNEIVRECRGLIIDENLNPVCVPFFKFGNYGEFYADEIDWNTAVVEEKIDGSLIKLWCYENEWIVSTNGTIFAEKATIGSDTESEVKLANKYNNFGQIFAQAIKLFKLDVSTLNPDYTYMFELCSPYNRVVVPHDKITLFHIGTRSNKTMKELDINIGIKKPKTYQCNNLTDLIAMASELKYCDEGYVVRDSLYKRVKVKSPAYVAVHRLVSGMTEKRLLELIRTNETSEFLNYFPEYSTHVKSLQSKVSDLINALEEIIAEKVDNIHYETRKDFAEMATKTISPAFLFSYYDERVKSPAEWLWSLSNDKILEQINRPEVQK